MLSTTGMGILDSIRGRRSIRAFTGEGLAPRTLERLVEALRWAPSAGNLQSRFFYLVTDAALRDGLAHAASQPFVATAPLVVVACADHRIRRDYGERGVETYCLMDVAAAVQNLLLVAHEEGLGTCWVGAFREREVRRLLDIPRHLRPVTLVPVGRPAEEPVAPPRDSADSVARVVEEVG